MVVSNWQPTAHLRYAAVSGQMQQLWQRECQEHREYNGRPRLCTWTEQQWRDIPMEQPSQETPPALDMSGQPFGDPHPIDMVRNRQCPICGGIDSCRPGCEDGSEIL